MLSKLFARFYDYGMRRSEKKYFSQKRKKITDLSGKIMELGCGTGVNFSYYSPKTHILALEPSSHMAKRARATIRSDQDIVVEEITLEQAQSHGIVEEGTYDAVVCTLVMCSVPEYEKTLEKMMKVLRKGGKLFIVEHIKSQSPIIAFLQNIFTPIQRVIADGCHLNRATDSFVHTLSLKCIEEEYFGTYKTYYYGLFQK